MTDLDIEPQALVDILKEIVQKLLVKRFQRKAKCYMKIDFLIFDVDDSFTVQVTKCSSGFPDIKILFTDVLKDHFPIKKKLDKELTVATVEEKSTNIILTRKIIYSGNTAIKVINEPTLKAQKEFLSLKYYISIKLLFQVLSIHLQEFKTLLLSYFKQLEKVDKNIKISLRKDKEYLYRNHVRMDDIVLSCNILSSSCATILLNSDNDFRKEIMNLLCIDNALAVEETIGCLLLAQVNNNFKKPIVHKRKQ